MALKHIFSAVSLFFLSASFFYSRPVHARESKFFSNTPAPAPGPATAPVPIQLESGYGLYGSNSEYSNTVTPQNELMTNDNYKNEVTLSESNNNIDEEMLSEDESSESEQPKNDDFYNNNNENGYFDNYKSSVTNSDNERQGMSDTRYVESGKYYYDIKSDHDDLTYQNNNGYSSSSSTLSDETIDPEVYGSSNEFNSMEEYYRSQP